MYTQALEGWKGWQEAVYGGQASMEIWKPKCKPVPSVSQVDPQN